MKKLFFAVMAVAAIFASCTKNEQPADSFDGQGNVMLTFKGGDAETRAFFNDSATAEAWETKINTASIYVYNGNGDFVLRRNFTSAEITAKKAVFSLPHSVRGTNCTFFVVANADAGDAATQSAVELLTDNTALNEYNGDAATVISGCKRAGGFVMTGVEVAAVLVDQTTNLSVTLKRNVAKVAVKATIAPEFQASYPGAAVFLTSAEISQVHRDSYLFHRGAAKYPTDALYSHTQNSQVDGSAYNNLFYVYSNTGISEADQRPTLKLTGIFDSDGNSATTNDQTEVVYTLRLTMDGQGMIRRNGYYRINASIKGLSGENVALTISVADWEPPVTENVDLGA